MSQKNQARNIGIFTILAIIILVAGILAFSSGTLFREEFRVEMVFRGDVTGLTVGSPVSFRGVIIGHVETIEISMDNIEQQLYVRVIAKIYSQERKITFIESNDSIEIIKDFIQRGVTAKLVTESILTGRLQVKFEFLEHDDKHLGNSAYGHPIVPTVPTDIERLERFLTDLGSELKGFEIQAFLKDLQATMANLSSTTANIDSIVAEANGGKYSLNDELLATTQSIRDLMNSLTETSDSAKPLVGKASNSLTKLDEALAEASATLTTYKNFVKPGSELSVSMVQTLKAIERSANQLRQLAETLQRNPESILSGKK